MENTNGRFTPSSLFDASHSPRATPAREPRSERAEIILFIVALERARRRRLRRDRPRRRHTGERHVHRAIDACADANDATRDARERSEASV